MGQNPGNAVYDALLMSRFQDFAADADKKQSCPEWFWETHTSRGFN